MRVPVPALVVGLMFGAGLALSDMINPARVLAFLDLAGRWDPTLAFVMGSALIPSALGYLIVRRMKKPVLADSFCIPENRVIERKLVLGAALFGAGWGLVGLCPGPAIAGLVFGMWQLWLFVGAMLGGMLLHRLASTSPAPTGKIPLQADS
jgi:uncharacterized membrane protein YedE/YeeE